MLLKGKKILVTGASGMVGSSIALGLSANNDVWGLARFNDHRLRARLENAGVRLITKDITKDSIEDIPTDFEIVFNQAVALGQVSPDEMMEINGYFVGSLMEHCSNAECIILGSSGAVYKRDQPVILTEESPTVPGSLYGVSKLIGDTIGIHVSKTKDIPTVILRYLFPYSSDPMVRYDYMQTMVKRVLKGEEIDLDDWYPLHQPFFVTDIADLTVKASMTGQVPPLILNAAGPEQLTIHQVMKTIGDVFKRELKLRGKGERGNYARYDLSRLKDKIGLGRTTLEEGLRRMKKEMEGMS